MTAEKKAELLACKTCDGLRYVHEKERQGWLPCPDCNPTAAQAPSIPASGEVVEPWIAIDRVLKRYFPDVATINCAHEIAALQAAGVSGVPNWSQMARAMQRIGACGTEEEIGSLLCNAAAPER